MSSSIVGESVETVSSSSRSLRCTRGDWLRAYKAQVVATLVVSWPARRKLVIQLLLAQQPRTLFFSSYVGISVALDKSENRSIELDRRKGLTRQHFVVRETLVFRNVGRHIRLDKEREEVAAMDILSSNAAGLRGLR